MELIVTQAKFNGGAGWGGGQLAQVLRGAQAGTLTLIWATDQGPLPMTVAGYLSMGRAVIMSDGLLAAGVIAIGGAARIEARQVDGRWVAAAVEPLAPANGASQVAGQVAGAVVG